MIDETRGRRMLFGAWLTVMGVIMWQEIKVNQRAPEPSRLAGATVAMAMLDLAAPTVGWPVAGVMGLGLAIGLSLLRVAHASAGPNEPGMPSSIGTANLPLGPDAPPVGPPVTGPIRSGPGTGGLFPNQNPGSLGSPAGNSRDNAHPGMP